MVNNNTQKNIFDFYNVYKEVHLIIIIMFLVQKGEAKRIAGNWSIRSIL